MSKIATIPVFSSIVAILFFLNCQRWDYSITFFLLLVDKLYYFVNINIFYDKINNLLYSVLLYMI